MTTKLLPGFASLLLALAALLAVNFSLGQMNNRPNRVLALAGITLHPPVQLLIGKHSSSPFVSLHSHFTKSTFRLLPKRRSNQALNKIGALIS